MTLIPSKHSENNQGDNKNTSWKNYNWIVIKKTRKRVKDTFDMQASFGSKDPKIIYERLRRLYNTPCANWEQITKLFRSKIFWPDDLTPAKRKKFSDNFNSKRANIHKYWFILPVSLVSLVKRLWWDYPITTKAFILSLLKK